ncbi:hypothetical protein F4780DRAFT_640853 [Xylariomycetidae sp. FL0641]|nr:hypothetical protein F4780DRAFT_640853 [Xylariomycetidae sp. FL0641]
MRGARIASRATEPLATSKTLDDRSWGVYTAVPATAISHRSECSWGGGTYAQACGGSFFSSSGALRLSPFMAPTGTLAILSVSSSSKVSVSLSSSSLRRLALPRPARPPYLPYSRLSSASRVERSSSPALIAAAESDTRWLPRWVKAPSMVLPLDRLKCSSLEISRGKAIPECSETASAASGEGGRGCRARWAWRVQRQSGILDRSLALAQGMVGEFRWWWCEGKSAKVASLGRRPVVGQRLTFSAIPLSKHRLSVRLVIVKVRMGRR